MHDSVLAAVFRAAAGTRKSNQTDVSMLGVTCMSVLDPGVKRSNCPHDCTGGIAGNTTGQLRWEAKRSLLLLLFAAAPPLLLLLSVQ